MKKLIICLFLLSFSTRAGYMSRSEMCNCNTVGESSYRTINLCGKSDCTIIPKNYSCHTCIVVDKKIIEDSAKKAAYEAGKISKATTRNAKNNSLKDVRQKVRDGDPLNANEIAEALEYLLSHLD